MIVWIVFDILRGPFYDPRTGNPLETIEGRQNRLDVDPFEGGLKIRPDLSEYTVIEVYEKDNTFLVKIDLAGESVSQITQKKQKLTAEVVHVIDWHGKKRRVIKKRYMAYDFSNFNPRALSESEARAMLQAWGVGEIVK